MNAKTIFRTVKQNRFTTVDNKPFSVGSKLSLKVRGLLITALCLPDDWKFNIAGLKAILPDGLATVKSCMRELKNAGYFRVEVERDENNRIRAKYYTLYENPELNPDFHKSETVPMESHKSDFHPMESHKSKSHPMEKDILLNNKETNVINNKLNKKEEKRKNHSSLLGTFEEKYRNGELYRINLKYNLPYMPDKKDYANYGDLSALMDDDEILQLYTFFAEGVSTGKFSDCYFSDTPVNLSRMNSYRVDLMALKAKKDKTTNVAYSPPVSPQHSKANQDKYLEYARSLGFNSVDEYLQDRQKRRAG